MNQSPPPPVTVALVEDEPADAELMHAAFESAGHCCRMFDTGAAVLEALAEPNAGAFSLMVVDWQLPDISGDEILRWTRSNIGWSLPVIFVTGRDSPADIVAMLEAGADDYMTKPVNLQELLARVTALVRRAAAGVPTSDVVEIDPYVIDYGNRRVTRSGEAVGLTPKEFKLAARLFANLGQLLARDELLQDIWGYGPEINTRTIDIHVSRLRKKLRLHPEEGWQLISIYQHGYRLDRFSTPT